MRLIDADETIVEALMDESDVVAEKTQAGVRVLAARHPTLGKLVIVKLPNGSGVLVEMDE